MEIISRSYHPAQAADYDGGRPVFSDAGYWSLAVQPFRAGGYEATLRRVDLQKAANLAALPRRHGPRVEADDRSESSLDSSRQRAKSMVRKRIKDMGGNRLCTLTVRQSDAFGYLAPEEWAAAFAKFVRMMRRAGHLADYVAVLEPHKKGLDRLRARAHAAASPVEWDVPLHIHFVTRSDFKMPINLMRKCWAVSCGRDGNIDVQWLRPAGRGRDSIDKVASYASKYISKGLAEFERFNKKRYWSAGESLQAKGMTWLRSGELAGAFKEALERLSLLDHPDLAHVVFMFSAQRGAWFNVRPLSGAPPPF